jgi:hypothetical protein
MDTVPVGASGALLEKPDNDCFNMQYCKRISSRERLLKYILRTHVVARE